MPPTHLSIFRDIAFFDLVMVTCPRKHLAVQPPILASILGMRELEKGHVAQLLIRVAEEALKRGIPPDGTPLRIDHADANSRMLEDGSPPLLTRT